MTFVHDYLRLSRSRRPHGSPPWGCGRQPIPPTHVSCPEEDHHLGAIEDGHGKLGMAGRRRTHRLLTTRSVSDSRFNSVGRASMDLNPDNVGAEYVRVRHTLAGVEVTVSYEDGWFDKRESPTNVVGAIPGV